MERVVVRGRPLAQEALNPATRDLLQAICRELGVCSRWHEASRTLYIDSPLTGKTIVLDPGHGGADRYLVGQSGLIEAEFVDRVADCLQELLEVAGATVARTRKGPAAVGTAQRLALIRETDPFVVISLHLGDHREIRGAQALVNPRQGDASSRLARYTLEAIADRSGLPVAGIKRWRKGNGGDSYGILEASQPAVVLELGQLGSAADETILRQHGTPDRLAGGILQGILRYLKWDGTWFLEPEPGVASGIRDPVPSLPPPTTSPTPTQAPPPAPPAVAAAATVSPTSNTFALVPGMPGRAARAGPVHVISAVAQAVRAGQPPPPPVIRFGSPGDVAPSVVHPAGMPPAGMAPADLTRPVAPATVPPKPGTVSRPGGHIVTGNPETRGSHVFFNPVKPPFG